MGRDPSLPAFIGRYTDRFASWGWDSYRQRFVYGHAFYELTAASSPFDLPIFLLLAQAKEHDIASGVKALDHAFMLYLDVNFYAPILMFVGVLLHFIGWQDFHKTLGLVMLGFGLLFFGLDVLEGAMTPFRNHPTFLRWMERLGDQVALGALVGAVFTVLIRSSSATVAIVITMAGAGLITLPTGVALMLGAEVGTCADTLVATIRGFLIKPLDRAFKMICSRQHSICSYRQSPVSGSFSIRAHRSPQN